MLLMANAINPAKRETASHFFLNCSYTRNGTVNGVGDFTFECGTRHRECIFACTVRNTLVCNGVRLQLVTFENRGHNFSFFLSFFFPNTLRSKVVGLDFRTRTSVVFFKSRLGGTGYKAENTKSVL